MPVPLAWSQTGQPVPQSCFRRKIFPLVHTARYFHSNEQQEIVTAALSNQTERVSGTLRGLLSSGRSDLATAVKLNVIYIKHI